MGWKELSPWTKGGIAFFILAFTCSIFYICGLTDAGLSGFFSGLYFLIFLAVVIGTFVFSFAIRSTEKKILKNEFSFWWLFKFNFVYWIVLTIIFEIILFLIPLLKNLGEGGMAIAVAMYYTPQVMALSVVIISLIPSFIYSKIRDSEKALRKLFYFVIGLSILLVILSIISLFTCNFNTSVNCLAEKALKTNNPHICDRAWSIGEPHPEERCYSDVAKKYSGTEDICSNIKFRGEIIKDYCYENLAYNTNNPNLCENIQRNATFNNCIIRITGDNLDPKLCEKIKINDDPQLVGVSKEDCLATASGSPNEY